MRCALFHNPGYQVDVWNAFDTMWSLKRLKDVPYQYHRYSKAGPTSSLMVEQNLYLSITLQQSPKIGIEPPSQYVAIFSVSSENPDRVGRGIVESDD